MSSGEFFTIQIDYEVDIELDDDHYDPPLHTFKTSEFLKITKHPTRILI